jgi:flagellar hook-associated protein 2
MGISASGIMSGLDVDGIVSQLASIERRPITALQQKEADFQVKLSTYGNLQGAVSSFKSAAAALRDAKGFAKFSAVSGNTDLFSASADSRAAAGSYKIEVLQLAQAHKLATQGAFGENEPMGAGTLEIQVGDGAATAIEIGAMDTLADVAAAINEAQAGVGAALIYDGSGYYLSLSADETGAANRIALTVTDADGVPDDDAGLSRLTAGASSLTQTQEALGSIIRIDDLIQIARDSNTLDDVIAGVTIDLLDAPVAPDNSATLTVSRDSAPVFAAFDDFVASYNQLADTIGELQSYNQATGAAGVLFGDSTTNLVRNKVRQLMSYAVDGIEGVNSLSDFGITMSNNRLELDTAKLSTALNDNFDATVAFFTRDEAGAGKGFAVHLVDSLNRVLDSKSGLIATRQDGIQRSIDDITDQIERKEARVLASEARMRAQFNALEVLLGEYQTTGNYLTQQLEGLANLNKSIAEK